jgi:hypothetical protein
LVAIAGCGGGDDETVTKAEFTAQANAICAKTDAKRDAAVTAAFKKQEASGKGSTDAFSQELISTAVVPPFNQMTEELSELEAPDPGAEEAAAVTAAFEKAVRHLEEVPVEDLDPQVDPFGVAKAKATAFGLKKCGEI